MAEAKKTIKRIASVDIYRGLVMFLMMAEVWHLSRVSSQLPNSNFWKFLAFNQSHVPWVGCSLHDLIQPSFTFLVGVALPYSILSRQKRGDSHSNMWYHAIRRSIILVLLGVFLRSFYSEITNWTFEDTLSQIGLGYPLLFFLGFKSKKWIWSALGLSLFLYWLAFALYPLPGPQFNYEELGLAANWSENLSGFSAHWNKNTNLAWAFDTWFLNLFPRESTFLYNGGGYATLSFIPTFGTMVLGLLAGKIMKSESQDKLKSLLKLGGGLLIVSLIIHFIGINPIVKRIWTPNWTLFSGAMCFFILAFFYWLVDLKGVIKPFNWLIIIGMNSIAAYIFAHTIDGFINHSFQIHLGQNYAQIFGEEYQTLVSGSVILLFEWLVLRWLYVKKVFIKI